MGLYFCCQSVIRVDTANMKTQPLVFINVAVTEYRNDKLEVRSVEIYVFIYDMY
jgi:hypothetical protein